MPVAFQQELANATTYGNVLVSALDAVGAVDESQKRCMGVSVGEVDCLRAAV